MIATLRVVRRVFRDANTNQMQVHSYISVLKVRAPNSIRRSK